MVVLRVLDDLVADLSLVAEECLVIVIRRQVAIYHLSVIAHSYLKLTKIERVKLICSNETVHFFFSLMYFYHGSARYFLREKADYFSLESI